MWKKIALSFMIPLIVFLGYVATREGKFHYERSGFIKASPQEIYPYISNLKLGSQWSPFEKKDLTMKKTYAGVDGAPGSSMDFEGNSDVGAGRIEIVSLDPNKSAELKLKMTKPFVAENKIIYKIIPLENGSVFTWAMEGDGGFMGKLMSTFIDCEKMIGDEFSAGIKNLKTLIEAKKV